MYLENCFQNEVEAYHDCKSNEKVKLPETLLRGCQGYHTEGWDIIAM